MDYTKEQKEEYLERARKEFPVGTKYYYMHYDGDIDTSMIKEAEHASHARTNSKDDWFIDVGSGYIFVRGMWTRKVETSKDNYLVIN